LTIYKIIKTKRIKDFKMFSGDDRSIDDRRVAVHSGGGAAVAMPLRAIFVSSDQDLSGLVEDEIRFVAGPDLLEDLDDEADMRTLKAVFQRNPKIFGKFLTELGVMSEP
jgi:hypothetical protein